MVYGITYTDIQEKYGVALSATRRYRKALESENIDCLFTVGERVRERSKLDDYETEILADFEKNRLSTCLTSFQNRSKVI